jgi:ABC-2 type transport system ATP-binding protein
MPAIEILGFQKNYTVGFWRKKQRTGLKPLSLSIESNEVFGFLGPNGAGKTTTIKLLMGLIFPSAGSARILGMDWRDPKVKSMIGFLPEQPYFYDHLTAPELLEYYAGLSGVPASERKRRAAAMLERVKLSDVDKLQLRKFSKGMLQRVGIAQAILHDPQVVVLDEPMSGLDPVGRREVRDLIQGLKDDGKTIFFSTHILADAESLCDRVGVIHKGELRGVGVVSELVTSAENANQTEVLWNGATTAIAAVEAAGAECKTHGQTARAILPVARLDRVLEIIRNHRGQIISVTPLRSTLEDYFIQQIGEKPQSALEVSR